MKTNKRQLSQQKLRPHQLDPTTWKILPIIVKFLFIFSHSPPSHEQYMIFLITHSFFQCLALTDCACNVSATSTQSRTVFASLGKLLLFRVLRAPGFQGQRSGTLGFQGQKRRGFSMLQVSDIIQRKKSRGLKEKQSVSLIVHLENGKKHTHPATWGFFFLLSLIAS